ncbi:MAG: HIT family protein [Paludibacteraceae bacterium]|nr:HIT family protein [Paludibacteraceae bacterium]MBO5013860.1 HIT family protein [Paludibacteraceae bacterium]MBP3575679.1 HIT family protein [Paludibacteraceae bacterium]
MTIFTRIINGEIPSYKVAENEHFYAFLDINPLQKGHTLVVPKLVEPEANYIFDLDDDLLSEMLVFSKQVARGIQGAIDCKRVGVAVIGLEVPHVHMHLIPISKEGDMSFANPKMTLPAEEMAMIANSIAEAMEH